MDTRGVKLTWLGHATFKITAPDKKVILIDPWVQSNPACPEALQHILVVQADELLKGCGVTALRAADQRAFLCDTQGHPGCGHCPGRVQPDTIQGR